MLSLRSRTIFDMTATSDGASLTIDCFPDEGPYEYTIDEVVDAIGDWQRVLGNNAAS